MYDTHTHISTQEVSISAKNDDKRTTWSHAAVRKSSGINDMALVGQHCDVNERLTTCSDVT